MCHKLRRAPRVDDDSFGLDVVILSERTRRPAARCVEDVVVYDYGQARKSTLRPFLRDVLHERYAQQEEARKRHSRDARHLMTRVEQLERSSWGRAAAREDLGAVDDGASQVPG